MEPFSNYIIFNRVVNLWLFIIYVAIKVGNTESVQINYIRVPHAVQNNSGRAAILDCDYTVRPDDAGLVIKWFLNGGPTAVYQWIPPQLPQGLGLLRDRLDLNYRVTSNPKTMHRALRILNPTTDIAGEYKCFVSTFNDEDYASKKMIIFEPEYKLVLRHTVGYGFINVSCMALSVYPEPMLFLYVSNYAGRKSIRQLNVKVSIDMSGRFDVSATATVYKDEVVPASLFDCEMSLPHTGYTRRTSRVYYPPEIIFNEASFGKLYSMKLIFLYGSLAWKILMY